MKKIVVIALVALALYQAFVGAAAIDKVENVMSARNAAIAEAVGQ